MTETAPSSVLLASPVRRSIVDLLADPGALAVEQTGTRAGPFPRRPSLTASELSRLLGLHVSTVRFHLDQLVSGGVLESAFVRTGGAGRPRKVYAVAATAPDDDTRNESLRVLSALLTGAFSAQTGRDPLTPEQAGENWAREHVSPPQDPTPAPTPGGWLSKVGQMMDVMRGWGYVPELTTEQGGHAARVDLKDCPFRELAEQNPTVICGIHRGLIAGTMARLGEPDTAVDLTPFVEPGLCVAHLVKTRPFPPPASARGA